MGRRTYTEEDRKKREEIFIERAKKKHVNEDGTPKYDYSITHYIDKKHRIKFICPIHGVVEQLPLTHLRGTGCKYCAYERTANGKKKGQEEFLRQAKEACKDTKYSFEKSVYKGREKEIIATCHELDEDGNEHGDFVTQPRILYQGGGCPKCRLNIIRNVRRKTKEQFIADARAKHGDKYGYSKVVYVNKWTPVEIICPVHGPFSQTPMAHLVNSGCKKCHESELEREIRVLLEERNITYLYDIGYQKFKWLAKMRLDFYLPDYNAAIECQGRQHLETNEFLDSDETVMKRDELKRKLCEEHGIRMFYFSNIGIEYPYKVYEDKEALLEEIKKS